MIRLQFPTRLAAELLLLLLLLLGEIRNSTLRRRLL
jgi:hypothetical protein